jgi:hypothetical protein
MTDEEISANRHKLFTGTVNGELRIFRAAEHMNEGRGWMMAGTDYPHKPHIVLDRLIEGLRLC